jgi:hypothetical protein
MEGLGTICSDVNDTFLQRVIVTHRRQYGFYFPPLVGCLRLSQVILSRCEGVRAGQCLDEVRPTCNLATDAGLPAAHRHGAQSLAFVRWLPMTDGLPLDHSVLVTGFYTYPEHT